MGIDPTIRPKIASSAGELRPLTELLTQAERELALIPAALEAKSPQRAQEDLRRAATHVIDALGGMSTSVPDHTRYQLSDLASQVERVGAPSARSVASLAGALCGYVKAAAASVGTSTSRAAAARCLFEARCSIERVLEGTSAPVASFHLVLAARALCATRHLLEGALPASRDGELQQLEKVLQGAQGLEALGIEDLLWGELRGAKASLLKLEQLLSVEPPDLAPVDLFDSTGTSAGASARSGSEFEEFFASRPDRKGWKTRARRRAEELLANLPLLEAEPEVQQLMAALATAARQRDAAATLPLGPELGASILQVAGAPARRSLGSLRKTLGDPQVRVERRFLTVTPDGLRTSGLIQVPSRTRVSPVTAADQLEGLCLPQVRFLLKVAALSTARANSPTRYTPEALGLTIGSPRERERVVERGLLRFEDALDLVREGWSLRRAMDFRLLQEHGLPAEPGAWRLLEEASRRLQPGW